jgi:lysophospholipase L1-like esterase
MQISCDLEFSNINFLTCIAWLLTHSPSGKKTSTDFSTWVTGFFESRKACCGTGTLETSLLCNAASTGTCTNATGYVFWDGFHPSEAANQVLAGELLSQGFSLIS